MINPTPVTATFGNSLAQFALGRSNAVDSVDWGTQMTDPSIDVYFGTAGYTADGVTSEGFNAYEIAQFEVAFDLISSVTNLTFNRVYSSGAADFKLVLDTDGEIGDYLGYFYTPGGSSIGVFNGAAWDSSAGGDLDVGGYGFVTIVHELLHGLGLAHPHDSGGSSPIMSGTASSFYETGTYELNQGVFTTMSYNNGYVSGPVGTLGSYGGWGYEAGPMALDIAVLQDKYGVNTSYNNGNNIYDMPDANTTGTMWSAIWDTGGVDQIRYTGARNVTIDLRAATLKDATGGGGWLSAADDIAGGYTIANGVVVENATGGSGDDVIYGNSAANLIKGGGGNDTLKGGGSKDTLIGGGGKDLLIGQNGNDVIKGGGGNDRIKGGSGNDLLIGNTGSDRFWGGGGNDRIKGGSGNDLLIGQSGTDQLWGGDGVDTFVFVAGADKDIIRDFIVGVDRLVIRSTFWGAGQTADDLVAAATIMTQGVVFNFGGGDVLVLKGLDSVFGLADDIFM